MGGDPDGDLAPADQQIRMVVLGFSDCGYRVDEGNRLDEILELVGLEELRAVDAPARQGREPRGCLRARVSPGNLAWRAI